MNLACRCGVFCLLILASCTSGERAAESHRPEADGGRDASTDGAVAAPSDAALDAAPADAGRADAGPLDASPPADAADAGAGGGDRVCIRELECTDCTYDPEFDLDAACDRESSYVLEGTCGAYRYRATGDGFVGGARYYRIDTGALVASLGYSDTANCSEVMGDVAVVKQCKFDVYGPDNLCCLTKNAYFIAFCEEGDGGI